MIGRRTLIKTAAVLVGTGALAGVAVAATSAPPAPPPAVAQERSATKIVAVDATQEATLAVLRRPVAKDDMPDDDVRQLVASGAGPSVGANPALARKALTTPTGEQIYVVPGRGWVCLAASGAMSNCVPTDRIAEGYAVSVQDIPSGSRLRGIVPDGVDRVEVRGDSGETATTAPSGNVWTVDVTFAPTSVAWTGDAGEKVVPVAAPPQDPVGPAAPPTSLNPSPSGDAG
ncbi:MAG TPA: hypothetical protein VGM33_26570 [Baekduia sp.]|jgi:hypothetical protein